MAAIARPPVLPAATLVGAQSAHFAPLPVGTKRLALTAALKARLSRALTKASAVARAH
jgi:hypothetical protein